ncbi:MAG: hypothetical protein ACN6ON_17495 [Sphingobacterium sp.]
MYVIHVNTCVVEEVYSLQDVFVYASEDFSWYLDVFSVCNDEFLICAEESSLCCHLHGFANNNAAILSRLVPYRGMGSSSQSDRKWK